MPLEMLEWKGESSWESQVFQVLASQFITYRREDYHEKLNNHYLYGPVAVFDGIRYDLYGQT